MVPESAVLSLTAIFHRPKLINIKVINCNCGDKKTTVVTIMWFFGIIVFCHSTKNATSTKIKVVSCKKGTILAHRVICNFIKNSLRDFTRY